MFDYSFITWEIIDRFCCFFSLDCKNQREWYGWTLFFSKRKKKEAFLAKNILLVISRTSAWMIYSRIFFAQNECILELSSRMCFYSHVRVYIYVCRRIIGIRKLMKMLNAWELLSARVHECKFVYVCLCQTYVYLFW